MAHEAVLRGADLAASELSEGDLRVTSPVDGAEIARLASNSPADTELLIKRSVAAFAVWKTVPAPRRGELVRLLGEELRARKDALAALDSEFNIMKPASL